MRLKAIRCVFKRAGVIALFGLASALSAQAQSPGAPAGGSTVWNDNSLIEIQRKGGDPSRPGQVKVEFYGHDAFKITSAGGLTVLTDPWRNDSTGAYPN
jgi:hypothetical protein